MARSGMKGKTTEAVVVGTANTGARSPGKRPSGYGGRISSSDRAGLTDAALGANNKGTGGKGAPGTGFGGGGGGGGSAGGGVTEETKPPGGGTTPAPAPKSDPAPAPPPPAPAPSNPTPQSFIDPYVPPTAPRTIAGVKQAPPPPTGGGSFAYPTPTQIYDAQKTTEHVPVYTTPPPSPTQIYKALATTEHKPVYTTPPPTPTAIAKATANERREPAKVTSKAPTPTAIAKATANERREPAKAKVPYKSAKPGVPQGKKKAGGVAKGTGPKATTYRSRAS